MGKSRNNRWSQDSDGWSSYSGRSAGWWETDRAAKGNLKPFREPPGELDPPPGKVLFDDDKHRAVFTFRKKVFSVSTAQGGWACTECCMPANRSNRTTCACCSKPKPDGAKVTPKAKASPKPKDDDKETEPVEDEVMGEPKPTCAAMTHTIPHMILLSGALVWPKDGESEGKTKATVEDRAQEVRDLEKEVFAAETFVTAMGATSSMAAPMKKEIIRLEGLLAKAKELAKESKSEQTPTQALKDLASTNELLSKKKKEYYIWHQKATAHKITLQEEADSTANQFKELADLLLAEAQAFAAGAKGCVEAWDAKNLTVDARMKAEIEGLKAKASEMSQKIPGAAEDSLPWVKAGAKVAVAGQPAAPTQLPKITPMVDIPMIDLPDSMPLLHACAGVRQVLHQMAEQEDEVREAYPLTWGNLSSAGLSHDDLTLLLSADIAGTKAEGHEAPVPKRIVGALRRQVDRLATLWEVKHAKLAMTTEAKAFAQAFRVANMDEAKRLQRKRTTPPAEEDA